MHHLVGNLSLWFRMLLWRHTCATFIHQNRPCISLAIVTFLSFAVWVFLGTLPLSKDRPLKRAAVFQVCSQTTCKCRREPRNQNQSLGLLLYFHISSPKEGYCYSREDQLLQMQEHKKLRFWTPYTFSSIWRTWIYFGGRNTTEWQKEPRSGISLPQRIGLTLIIL